MMNANTWNQFEPHALAADEKDLIQSNFDSAKNNLIGYLGGESLLNDAASQWNDLKNNPEKIALVLSLWKEHEKDYFQTVTINLKELSHRDTVLLSSAIVKTDKEAKQQDAMVNAVETYAGGSNPDEEVKYEFVEEKSKQK